MPVAFCSSFFGVSAALPSTMYSTSSVLSSVDGSLSFTGGERFTSRAPGFAKPHHRFNGARPGPHRYSGARPRASMENTSPPLEYGFSPRQSHTLTTPPRLETLTQIPHAPQLTYTPASSDSSVGSFMELSAVHCASPGECRGVPHLGYSAPAAYLSPLSASSARAKFAGGPALSPTHGSVGGHRAPHPLAVGSGSGFEPVVPVIIGVESDQHKIQQREKQIGYGKSTKGYANYLRLVPVEMREPDNEDHPVTPCARHQLSKRSWDGQLKTWRRLLHRWDNAIPDGEEGVEASSGPYEGDRSEASQSAVTTTNVSPVPSQPGSPSKQLSFGDEEFLAATAPKKVFRSWASECSDTSDYMDLSDFNL